MTDTHAAFASYVATLGRGPGRSRALTREEARSAFRMVLRGEADPHQVGAFLMLLRFRGEDAEEITGIVEAAREHAGIPADAEPTAALDWPSYGAGRTRGAPWFVLAALALARSGVRVLMHGSNEFSAGISVPAALQALAVVEARFTYRPLRAVAPGMDDLLGMRRLFGLRSPVNTAVRLLNPANAPAGVDGVFHPAYIDVHLGVAERMRRGRLLVLKGGGGEAERNPTKPMGVAVWDAVGGRQELTLPAISGLAPHVAADDSLDLLTAVWRGANAPGMIGAGAPGISGAGEEAGTPVAIVQATIAMALQALGHAQGRTDDPAQAMTDARDIWRQRL
jgi:anthranilate phosphoribosyltransferase